MTHKLSAWLWTAMAASLLLIPSLVHAHEGEDHEPATILMDTRLAPRFEIRGDEVEVVGVLANKTLIIYLDRADDNAPIENAQIDVEGPGIKGIAMVKNDGVYQLPAETLSSPGRHALTITIEAEGISDLLSAELEIPVTAEAVPVGKQSSYQWWFIGVGALLLGLAGFVAKRMHRRPMSRNT